MNHKSAHSYLLIEDSYLLRKSLTDMISELRPKWVTLGFCEHTRQIKQGMTLNPDFILADSHISDGESIEVLRLHASHSPMIFYTHLINETEARKSLPNIVKFIYEPVSREEMSEAVAMIEDRIGALA